ncbi:hypothetical protein GTW69_25780, partial [Streptomyces sp. SID7760]|nr:hypothetical protein [Streptomyces sp. SID7760]
MTPQPMPSPRSGEPSPRSAGARFADAPHAEPAPRSARPQAPDPRDTVIALSPFEEPWPRIVIAAERAGSLGLL